MIIRVFSLFLLIATQDSLCFDLELEGVMRVGRDFLRTLADQPNYGDQFKLPMPLSFMSKGKLPRKSLGDAVMRAAMDINRTNQMLFTHNVNEYVSHLQKKGLSTLRAIGHQIRKEIIPLINITPIVEVVTSDYVNMMSNYHEFLKGDTPETQIDKEFIYLDLIETSSRLLYGEERKLLNDVLVENNGTIKNTSLQTLNERIYKRSVKDKMEEMNHICGRYEVCRIYPAFSDYCADFISEILKLSEKKFQKFLEDLIKIIKKHERILEMMSETQDRELMSRKLQSYYGDTFAMKEFFAVSRSVMTQRFKLIPTRHIKLKMRTKAMRILLDIIDKALGMEEDILAMDFETTMSALRSWSGGVRQHIYDIFGEFASHLIKTLEHRLTKNARKEISVLIELVVRGSTDKTEIYQRLFKYGSSYVGNKELPTDPDLM